MLTALLVLNFLCLPPGNKRNMLAENKRSCARNDLRFAFTKLP